MYEHRDRLNVPVVVGVGAAFDINSGSKKQAPAWMREHGLEWLFRLLQEPRRLWRRYILYGSEFVLFASLELIGISRPLNSDDRNTCLLYTSPSPRDLSTSRMPSSA